MTVEAMIYLPTITDVKNFINTITNCGSDVDLKSGRYVVDAKSLMGIFSLDLDQAITIVYPIEEEWFIKENILNKWGVK